ISLIDLVKFQAISESFRNRMIFDYQPSPIPMENPTESTSHKESGRLSSEVDTPTLLDDMKDRDQKEEEQDPLEQLMEDVEHYLEENDLGSVITADRTERGVVLVLQESILFDSAEAEILESGKPFLNKVGTLLAEIPNHVNVEGHTATDLFLIIVILLIGNYQELEQVVS